MMAATQSPSENLSINGSKVWGRTGKGQGSEEGGQFVRSIDYLTNVFKFGQSLRHSSFLSDVVEYLLDFHRDVS